MHSEMAKEWGWMPTPTLPALDYTPPLPFIEEFENPLPPIGNYADFLSFSDLAKIEDAITEQAVAVANNMMGEIDAKIKKIKNDSASPQTDSKTPTDPPGGF